MNLTPEDLASLAQQAIAAATRAGGLVTDFIGKNVEVQNKPGGNSLASQVVTEVDLRAESIIVESLRPAIERFDLGLLTEERGDDGSRLAKDYFWCIDPIDGTLSFIEGVPGYAVSIALVAKSGAPQIGVVYDPLSGTLYSAVKDQGAVRGGKPWSLAPGSSLSGKALTLVCDRSLEDQPFYPRLLEQFEGIAERSGATGLITRHKGGAVMNGCWTLENHPACYFKFPRPRQGGGSVWDFAAIACLFQELGAVATDFEGSPLQLNNVESTFMNRRGVLFSTEQSLVAEIQGLDLRV